MKKLKIILVDILLLFVLCVLIHMLVAGAKDLKYYINAMHDVENTIAKKIENPAYSSNTLEDLQYFLSFYRECATNQSILVAAYSISICACGFLVIYCNPKLFRRSTWTNLSEEWAKNRQERAAARVAKAETDKQKRIDELQAELDGLHGSDKSD